MKQKVPNEKFAKPKMPNEKFMKPKMPNEKFAKQKMRSFCENLKCGHFAKTKSAE